MTICPFELIFVIATSIFSQCKICLTYYIIIPIFRRVSRTHNHKIYIFVYMIEDAIDNKDVKIIDLIKKEVGFGRVE